MAANTPIMATTIISSMRVKPLGRIKCIVGHLIPSLVVLNIGIYSPSLESTASEPRYMDSPVLAALLPTHFICRQESRPLPLVPGFSSMVVMLPEEPDMYFVSLLGVLL